MTAPKVTDWYSGDQKPAYRGIYKRKTPNGDVYWSCWVGGAWGVLRQTKIEALADAGIYSSLQSLPWRGLAEKP